MRNVAVFLTLNLFLFGCKNSNSDNEYEFVTKTIKWSFNKEFEIKDIVSNMQFILLEETPESIFSEIYKLIIKNDRIYILDIKPKALLVFHNSGKFLHKIGGVGGGPGEYTGSSIMNFTVTEDDEVFLYDYEKRSMMKYDKNGKYINSKKSTFSFIDFLLLPDNQFMLSLDIHEKKNSKRKVMLTDDLKKMRNSYLHFNENFKHDKLNMVTFQPFEDKIAYLHPVNDTLYIFDNQGALEQAWFFDFGNRKLPEELKNDYERASDERRRGGNRIFIYNTPICIKNYIISELFVGSQKGISVYDTTKNILTHELFTSDKFSLYNINTPLCTVSDSIVVSYLDADTYYYIKDNYSINPEVDAHLNNGGVILILNTIN